LDWLQRKSSSSAATPSLHRRSNARPTPIAKDEAEDTSLTRRDTRALGLHIIHEPNAKPIADIIFVHGLGGHSYETWSHNHDTELFWPGRWLPKDPKIGKARLFTYGYDSHVTGPETVANITGFAKSLLFDMRHSRCNRDDSLNLGDAPIIFVAHSMGGLVVKKAYLMAHHDSKCKGLVQAMSAMIFLSTPHRGSGLANTLGLILKLTLQPKVQYIAELAPDSSAIEDINEQFRHVAMKLSIIAFHETLPTLVGLKSVMIVTKDSALLGYGNEESRPLEADHHTVCKFKNEDDSKYIIVRDVLKGLVENSCKSMCRTPSKSTSRVIADVKKLLALSSMPTDDLNALRKRWVIGTCEWVLKDPAIRSWMTDLSESQLVWYNAPPGSGKSVLSSYIIHHLRTNQDGCQFYFFNYRDQTHRSLVGMLKSLTYQIACDVPEFAAEILAASSRDDQLAKGDHRLLWQKLFETSFFNKDLKRPLFWVIDGLDESESTETVIGLLEELILKSRTTMKILVTSRRSETLALRFRKLQRHFKVDVIDAESQTVNARDIELLVSRELEFIPGDASLKARLEREILQRARGNFLWVSLVLEELQMCQTEKETRSTLEQIPEDMTKMYERMQQTIIKSTSKRRLELAKELLQWAVCVPRPLTIAELDQAIRADYDDLLDLRRSIRDVCGQFLVIDGTDHVSTVHQTARDFLVKGSNSILAIHRQSANNMLLVKTLSSLCGSGIRKTVAEPKQLLQIREELQKNQPFVLYGVTSWIYHLGHADPISDEVLDTLESFFSGPCVLDWICILAIVNQVRTLAKAAKAILTFVTANRKSNVSRNPLLHRLSTVELLENWAGDLVRLTAKFNKHLITQPHAIYETIPALCPPTSAINRQFQTSKLVLSGQSESWNDIFARFSLSQAEVAGKVVSRGPHLAVLVYGGKVYVWSSADFAEVCVLRHGEAVTNMCMNNKGDILVTYGLTSTKVWDLPDGAVRLQAANQGNGRAMSLVFAMNDECVVAATSDRSVKLLQLTDDAATWKSLDSALLQEQTQSLTTIVNSPSYMEINASGTQVGVCYRSFPLTIWDLNSASVVSRCMRPGMALNSTQAWSPVETFAWNPISGHVIGWYKGNNKLFKWNPLTDENHEVSASVDELVASPNGQVFLTSDSNGTVKVWNFAYFSVIYQLSSGDLVRGLSFSPDSTRFYDIRGGTITAWEPNGLTRLGEAEDTFSDTASNSQGGTMISHLSEATAPRYTALSVLAAAPSGLYFATGNVDGEVHLAEVDTASRIELTRFHNFLPVAHLSWDLKSEAVAAADLAGDIRIVRVRHREPDHRDFATVEHLPTPKLDMGDRAIHQLLLDCSSHLLLVVSNDRVQTWEIDEGRLGISADIDHADRRCWLNNTTDPDLFMGVGPEDIHIHRWSDLRKIFVFRFNNEQFPLLRQRSTFSEIKSSTSLQKSELRPSEAEIVRHIQKVMLAQDNKHILVHVKEQISRGRVQHRLLVVAVKSLEIPQTQLDIRPLDCLRFTNDLDQRFEFPLGILSGEHLVFLDRDLWLCSMNLSGQSAATSPKRHYFIPRDWTDVEGLRQCSMLRDGTLLCPQEGKIVTVKTNFGWIGD
jgi:WD40 repeat protein